MKESGWRVLGGTMGIRSAHIVEQEKIKRWLIGGVCRPVNWKDYTVGNSRKC
jgi:hypothetical protein